MIESSSSVSHDSTTPSVPADTNSSKSPMALVSTRALATCSRPAMSILFTAASATGHASSTQRPTKASPGPTPAAASTTRTATSTSDRVPRARLFSRSPSSVRGRCTPGVSTKTIWYPPVVRMPRTARRVVWGRSLTMATFPPHSALTSVDLPVLGRPATATKPERKSRPDFSDASVIPPRRPLAAPARPRAAS